MTPRLPLLLAELLEDRVVPATFIWDDGGINNNWSTDNNWVGNVAPLASDTNVVIVFNTMDASTIQDIAGLDIDQLRFDAGADITLALNQNLTINDTPVVFNIVDQTGLNAITGAGDIVFAGGQVDIQTNAAVGALVLAVDLTGTNFVKDGVGVLELAPPMGNTYTGTANVDAGTLRLNSVLNEVTIPDDLVIGDGVGAAGSAILQLVQNFEIDDGVTLTINSDGLVDVAPGFTEDLTTLAVNGGQLNVQAGAVFQIETNGTVSSDGTTGSQVSGAGILQLESTNVTFNIADGAGGTDLVVSAVIGQAAANTNLTKAGTGTLEFAMTSGNTYTGTTTIADGTLLLNTATADAGLSGAVAVGDGAGAAGSAVLQLGANNFEIANLASITINGDGRVNVPAGRTEDVTTVNFNGGQLDVAAGGTFRIPPGGTVSASGAAGSEISGAGSLVLGGAIVTFAIADGAAATDLLVSAVVGEFLPQSALTKTGAGRLTLTANNTYLGTTTVNGGVLEVNGTQTGSPVTVTAGSFGGDGAVGPLTATGGSVSPSLGFSPFPITLNSGSANLAGGAFAPVIYGNSVGVDELAVTGTVTLAGATLAAVGTGLPVPGGTVFQVITNDGNDAVVGTFAGLPQGASVVINGQTYTISYTGGSGNDVALTATANRALAVSGQANGSAAVFLPNGAGQYPAAPAATLTPFAGFVGTVRTATADVNGDGTADTVLVTGPGGPVRVAVISGADNTTVLVAPFDPFQDPNFTGGGFAAAADIDGDGKAEFLVTPDQGGGPRVSIFTRNADATTTRLANFLGIDDANFRGGARAALGDVDADGTPDLIVCAGFLGGPRTAVFNGVTLLIGAPIRMVNDFFAFPGTDATTLRNGVFVSAGDVDGDGFAELVFGGGPGGAPRVFILSGLLVSAGDVGGAQAAPVANFFVAGNAADRGGVRVATKAADGDSRADVVTGSGEGSPGNVRVYLAANFVSSAEPGVFQDLSVFGGGALPGGVFVG